MIANIVILNLSDVDNQQEV